MLKKQLFRAAQIIILGLLFIGCRKKASDEIGFGSFDKGNVYTNSYFGMTLTIPTDWSIQDKDAQARLTKLGKNIISGDDKNMQAMMKASELQTVNLFTAFEYAPGAPVLFNPSVISVAEKVSELPGIKTGKDYEYHAKKLFENSQMKPTFPKEIYTKPLGGVDFDILESELKVRDLSLKQRYYTTIRKGYALCFVISYSSDADNAAIEKVLDTVKFN